MSDLYDTDLHAWSQRQAELLRRRAANELDWDNIAEEIEGVGASEKHQIKSRLEVLCHHLLKWRYQPELLWQLARQHFRAAPPIAAAVEAESVAMLLPYDGIDRGI